VALRAVPDLVTAAQPGKAVESYLREREAELNRVTDELRTLTSLREREESLRDRLAELAPLRAKVDELRRLERLVTALDELNESERLISDRVAALKARTAEPERGIATAGAELVRLTREQTDLLAPRAREVLGELATAQAGLAEVEERARRAREELAEVAARHTELAAERDQRVAELTAHAAVDRAIAEALTAAPGFDAEKPALTQVRAATEEIEHRLSALDQVLAKALKTRDERHHRANAELPWSG
jgi:chromosome segregation ATPase